MDFATRRTPFRLLAFALLCIVGYSVSKTRLPEYSVTIAQEPLYLPSGEHLRLLTLGFHNLTSDLLWFSTIDYFGREFAHSGDFHWLAHMCDLATSLDERATARYEFCGSLLSWVAKDPHSAKDILDRGVKAHPKYWRLRYLRGFNSWYFLEDLSAAKNDFEIAATLPDAPEFLGTLASRLDVEAGNPSAAVALLRDLISHAQNSTAKKALQEKLQLARVSLHRYLIEKAAKEFFSAHGYYPQNLEALVADKRLDHVFKDPFHGEYSIDQQSGKVFTSSGVVGLDFHAKTARTGVLRQEFQDLK